jgi:16S rRNA A1518/A1519 N6-dimethyltransferase RsmA/KsgA/DIM1 with predicted DNA glycosylase/AP lyase activity
MTVVFIVKRGCQIEMFKKLEMAALHPDPKVVSVLLGLVIWILE